MDHKRIGLQAVLAGCASAALVGAVACGPNNKTENPTTSPEAGASATSGVTPAAGEQPMTVSGCLQRADGEFVVTTMNEPDTAGAPAREERPDTAKAQSSTGNKVASEQYAEARHAYKLNSDNQDDTLEGFLGKRVTVQGTLTRQSDLAQESRTDYGASDLAAIHVTHVEEVAGACGDAGK